MATRIRLKRIGRRNRPFYRVVVMDSRQRRDGAAIEELGWYNPIAKDKENNFKLDEERIFHWLKTGAQPSEIAHKLMKRAGIAFKWHLMKQGLDEKAIEKEVQKLDLRREAQAKEKLESADKELKKKVKEAKKEEVEIAGIEDSKSEEVKIDASNETVEEVNDKNTETKTEDQNTEVIQEDKIEEKVEAKESEEKSEVKEEENKKTDKKDVIDEKTVEKAEETVEEITTKKSTPKDEAQEDTSAENTESKDEVKDDK